MLAPGRLGEVSGRIAVRPKVFVGDREVSGPRVGRAVSKSIGVPGPMANCENRVVLLSFQQASFASVTTAH